MNYKEALQWVHGLPRLGCCAGVENEQRLLAQLGSPEKTLQFVHIAGTNGKGSTTAMLASILHCAGYCVGMTISPYVIDFRERFQINGYMIESDELAEILTTVRAAVNKLAQNGWGNIAEFDVITAAALLWFARRQCDIVCMETGLGGRFDATNAVQNTLVACITRIGKDHIELLGDSFSKIAYEKCGILKNGCDVVVYPEQRAEAMQVIMQQAKHKGCTLWPLSPTDFTFYEGRTLCSLGRFHEYQLSPSMPGRHQIFHAGMAVQAIRALKAHGFLVSAQAIECGIAQAVLPARLEVLCEQPLILLDGMHNTDGAQALAELLKQHNLKDLILLIGVLHGKAVEEMLLALAPYVQCCFATAALHPRAMPAHHLAEYAQQVYAEVHTVESLNDALRQAMHRRGRGLLICGSLYLASQVRAILTQN